MITIEGPAYLVDGTLVPESSGLPSPAEAKSGTMACRILEAHNRSETDEELNIVFDSMMSHDISYVGIIQTARASGLTEFPVPYALTNCHNTLCAVGGTINEDDHAFGLSAAKKYGGIFVPGHMAVIHQFARETMAGCGKMILGSDSHTRYGALGCMGFGEGGGELAKQLLGRTYDLPRPEVVAVWLEGSPVPGVGPHDVALDLIRTVFKDGLVKNKVLEFIGPGVANLSTEFRIGIDVMTTETACLSSIWLTDDRVRDYLTIHGREQDFKPMAPAQTAYYDAVIRIDLGAVRPMIALPFHPSNAFTIEEFHENAEDILADVEKKAMGILNRDTPPLNLRQKLHNGRLKVDQASVAGCSGGLFENMARMAEILKGHSTGRDDFWLSLYPSSQPQRMELVRNGMAETLMESGATLQTSFCGPCFGVGDVPANNRLSIRHTTRNFANREGSKPANGQIAYVALMDARSIAATARNKGILTAATELPDVPAEKDTPYHFDQNVYAKRVYYGFGAPEPEVELVYGPNITDWPDMAPLPENLVLTVCSTLRDPVTTTDELIPSGETSSLRSNPQRLAEFTLSGRDPGYVARAKAAQALEAQRVEAVKTKSACPEVEALLTKAGLDGQMAETGLGSLLFAYKPGDGSAREQAASSQKVLGGWANIAGAYATKRYRSNMINWGLLPFVTENIEQLDIQTGDLVVLPSIKQVLSSGGEAIEATVIGAKGTFKIPLQLPDMTPQERKIIQAGCLINSYAED
ncbi:hydratase [Pseudodesulfovibrio sp.]|uniref:hydratase n=1 Tax=unclassified Pseudodesulfovibrio TaxID=2661612 RepID=UPI003B0027F5